MNNQDEDDEPQEVQTKSRGRKPSRSTVLKALEKEILQSTLRIKKEKTHYEQLVNEYNRITESDG